MDHQSAPTATDVEHQLAGLELQLATDVVELGLLCLREVDFRRLEVGVGIDVYLNGYATLGELLIGLTKYFVFYNGERPHQAMGNRTPDAVHASAIGGGAIIVDKYGATQGLPIALRCTATEFGQVRIENESVIQNTKTGAAPSS